MKPSRSSHPPGWAAEPGLSILGRWFRLGRRGPYYAAFLLVLWATAAAEGFHRIANAPRVPMLFLAAVLITAFLFGAAPAYFAAALAFVVFNIYVAAPDFDFTFAPEDFITLLVFFAVAMLTGNLTGRVRDEAMRNKTRADTMAQLFEATREFSRVADEDFIRQRLANRIAAMVGGTAIVRAVEPGGPAPVDFELPAEAAFEEVFRRAEAAPSSHASHTFGSWVVRALVSEEECLGAAAWRIRREHPMREDEQAFVELMIDAGAAAIARASLARQVAESEGRETAENLRNALFSSISHDIRTPLTSIIGSASTLREFPESLESGVTEDLLDNISEEAERLNTYVSNLLNMTKLESGVFAAEHSAFTVREVLDRLAGRLNRQSGREVKVLCPQPDVQALGDPVLFEQALANVLENAVRYTPQSGRIRLFCRRRDACVVVAVADEGTGVKAQELPLLFVKFYRAASTERLPGTGLGLSITKGLVEAMGGSVSARNRSGGRRGLVVTMTLPAAAA